MADTGWLNPSSASNVDRDGKVAWSNTTNVYTSNDSDASSGSVPKNDYSDWLYASNFGASIPAGREILGIEIKIERAASAASDVADSSLRIYNGTALAGDDKASATAWGTTDATATYGTTSDDWNASLTVTQANSTGFGVYLSIENNNGFSSRQGFVDHIQIRITYSDAGDVYANTDALTLTEYAATIEHTATYVDATTAALTLTEYAATIDDGLTRADTGWVFPTVGSATSSCWPTPERITASDNSRSTYNCTLAAGQESGTYLYGSTFNIDNIPQVAEIEGIEARWEGRGNYSTFGNKAYPYIFHNDGWYGTGTLLDFNQLSGDTTVIEGSSTEKWGTTLTREGVYDDLFSIAIRAYNTGVSTGTPDIRIDAASVKVHYKHSPFVEGDVKCGTDKLYTTGHRAEIYKGYYSDTGWLPIVGPSVYLGTYVSGSASDLETSDDSRYVIDSEFVSNFHQVIFEVYFDGTLVPSGAGIDGIEVDLEGSSDTTLAQANSYTTLFNAGGSAYSTESLGAPYDSTERTFSKGSTGTDDWGGADTNDDQVKDRDWVDTDFNSGNQTPGFYTLSYHASTAFTIEFDLARMRVHYTLFDCRANTDTLTITTYAAGIDLSVDVQAGTDNLVITTYPASLATDVFATTDALILTEYQSTVSLDATNVNVNTNVDALLLTEYNASIDFNISAGTDTLTLSTYQATVENIATNVDVNANTDALILTTNNASVDFNLSAGFDALTISTLQATVENIATNVDVNANTDTLTVSAYRAFIDKDVAAQTDNLTVTGQQATIDLTATNVNVIANTASLTLTTYIAKFDHEVITVVDELIVTGQQATVELVATNVDVQAITDALIITVQSASIDFNLNAQFDSLTLSTHQVTVENIANNVSIDATVQALTLAPYDASIDFNLSAGTVALALTTYPSTVELIANNVSIDATVVSMTLASNRAFIDFNLAAQPDVLVVSGQQATIDLVANDVNVIANTAALTITTYQAKFDYLIDATTDVLTLSPHSATVELIATNVDVSAAVSNLTLTGQQATVENVANNVDVLANTDALIVGTLPAFIDFNLHANTDSLTVATHQATVQNVATNVDVQTNTDNLIIVGHSAGVTLDVFVSANTNNLTVTTLGAGIQLIANNIEVNAGLQVMSLVEHPAGISLNANDVNISADLDALTMAAHQANIGIRLVNYPPIITTMGL